MDNSLDLYQRKLKEAITLVPRMDYNSQLTAVEFWNNISSELQKIVHKSSLSYNQSNIVGGDYEKLNSMQYMTANHSASSSTADCAENVSGITIMNMPVTTTNTAATTLPLVNSSGVINQQCPTGDILDKSYYEDIYQKPSNLTKALQQNSFENKLSSNSVAQIADEYAIVSNETLSSSLNSLQLNSSDPLIAQNDLNNSQNSTNNLYDLLKHSEIDSSISDQQAENSIVDIAADILASETYLPLVGETIRNLNELPETPNNKIASSGELGKVEQLVIDDGEEFNNVVTIASSLSCEPRMSGELYKQFDNSVQYINYNVDTQLLSLNQNSSIQSIDDQLCPQSDQPLQQIQPIDSNFLSQTQCSVGMESRLYFCSKCNQQFESLPELEHHEKLHWNDKNSSFSTREEANIYPSEVKMEILADGGGDIDNLTHNNSQHICDICNKSFSTAGNLKRHNRSHSGIKPYKCDHCDSAFTEKKSLVIHLRRHTGERPYKCDICGKLFAQGGVLSSHMALHRDERKFECPKCNKTFRQKSQLKLHLLRHDGVKPFKCQICMACFLVKADLTRHSGTHTGQRNFACDICDKMFTRKQSLNEHMNRHTGTNQSLENSRETKSPDAKLSSS